MEAGLAELADVLRAEEAYRGRGGGEGRGRSTLPQQSLLDTSTSPDELGGRRLCSRESMAKDESSLGWNKSSCGGEGFLVRVAGSGVTGAEGGSKSGLCPCRM